MGLQGLHLLQLVLAVTLVVSCHGMDLPLSWDFSVGGTYTVQQNENLQLQWSSYHSVEQLAYPGLCSSQVVNVLANPSPEGMVTLDTSTPGMYFYACGVPGHCGAGMRITVVVNAPADPPPPPPPQPVDVPPAQPPPSPPVPLPAGEILWQPGIAPLTVTVFAGDPVTLVWSGGSPHNVQQTNSDDCFAPIIAVLAPDSVSGSVTLDTNQPGIFFYQSNGTDCELFGMHFTLSVLPAAPPPPLPPLDLMPGELWWTPDFSQAEVTVQVGEYLALRWVGPDVHDVVMSATADCTSPVLSVLVPAAPAGLSVIPTTTAGVFYYRDDLGTDCSDGGMAITVVVVAHNPPPVSSPPLPPLVLGPNDIHWTFGIAPLVKSVPINTPVALRWEGTVPHSVQQIASDNCTSAIITQLSDIATAGAVSLPTDTAGTYYFKCGVGTHCADGGMHFTLIVQPPAPPPHSEGVPPRPSQLSPPKPKKKSPPPPKHKHKPPPPKKGSKRKPPPAPCSKKEKRA